MNPDTAVEAIQRMLAAGHQPPLPPHEASGNGGGMDPWQTSVENRLGSLDGRLSRIETDLGKAKEDLATVKADVRHLPSKGFIVTATLTALAGVAAISTFVQWVLAAHPH